MTTPMSDALRQVCRDFHVGALVDALNDAARSNSGRLPGAAVQLALRGHDLLLSLGLAGRDGPDGRAVWQWGVSAKPVPSLVEVDAWVERVTAFAGDAVEQPVYVTTQWLLSELADDPGMLAELCARLASVAVGGGTT